MEGKEEKKSFVILYEFLEDLLDNQQDLSTQHYELEQRLDKILEQLLVITNKGDSDGL